MHLQVVRDNARRSSLERTEKGKIWIYLGRNCIRSLADSEHTG